METKSIEQLEKDIWKEPSEFPTTMIERCYRYRKISLSKLSNDQLRLLISQKIGLEYIVKIALKKLENNILLESDFYEGDLLIAYQEYQLNFGLRMKRNSRPLKFCRREI